MKLVTGFCDSLHCWLSSFKWLSVSIIYSLSGVLAIFFLHGKLFGQTVLMTPYGLSACNPFILYHFILFWWILLQQIFYFARLYCWRNQFALQRINSILLLVAYLYTKSFVALSYWHRRRSSILICKCRIKAKAKRR